MAKFLITGARGLIGSAVVARLADQHELWCLVRTAPDPSPTAVQWVEWDLSLPGMPDSLPDSIDAVIHLAQSNAYRDFPSRAKDVFQVNVASTAWLLDWAGSAGASRFVLASSGGVYDTGETPVVESAPLPSPAGPLGYYFATKRTSELLLQAYRDVLVGVALRFFFVYGPGQSTEMLMPRLIDSVRSGRSITLQGEDGILMNPIAVEDAARAVEKSLALDTSEIINVAGSEAVSIRKAAETIGDLAGIPPHFEVDRTATPNSLVADITKMQSMLADPQVSLRDGLRLMIHGRAGKNTS